MVDFCRRISTAPWFQNFILGFILLAGVVVGMQTYREFEADHRQILNLADQIILGIFVLEVLIKIIAEGKSPWNYFRDPWNIFDFAIVAICLLPIQNSQFIAVLRLARVLRVLKLVSAIPRLQVLVNAVLKSIPSIGYVFLLGLLHFYIYGCMATFLFSENDPETDHPGFDKPCCCYPPCCRHLFCAKMTVQDSTSLVAVSQLAAGAFFGETSHRIKCW